MPHLYCYIHLQATFRSQSHKIHQRISAFKKSSPGGMAAAKVVVAPDPKGRAATVPWAVDLALAGTPATTPTDSSRAMAAAAAVGDYHLAGKAPRIPPAARLITSIVPPMMLGLEGTQLRNMGDLCSDVV